MPRTYLQDASVAKDHQPAVDAALVVHLFTAGGEHDALGIMQTAEVLLVPAVDDARAPGGDSDEAACEEGRVRERRAISKNKKT